jgi:hypothetical protein
VTPVTYRLKDVDLSSHVTGAWLTEPRLRDGRWTTGGGRLLVISRPNDTLAGRHARYKDPERSVADSFRGITVKDDTSFSAVDWDGLMHTAADPNASPTERELAVRKVTLHLEQMKRRVQVDTSTGRRTATVTSTRATLKVGPALKPVAVKTEHYVKDTASDASRVALTTQVLGYAVRAAGAAAALIGVHESEQMVEALHKIAENPAIESGVNVALTLLISLLIARIQKAFRDRHDRRIAKARGELT